MLLLGVVAAVIDPCLSPHRLTISTGCWCRLWFDTSLYTTHCELLMPSSHMIYLIVYLLQQHTDE